MNPNDQQPNHSTIGTSRFYHILLRSRFLTACLLVIERLWPFITALLCLIALFFALSWFGLFRFILDWARFVLVGGFLIVGITLLLGLRHVRLPSQYDVDRRLEQVNHVAHEGLSLDRHKPSVCNSAAMALWGEHRKRMRQNVDQLKIGTIRSTVPDRDPFGLRVFVALLFVSGFAFSYSGQSGNITDAFLPAGQTAQEFNIRVDAWVTPPSYTRRAPLFLTQNTQLSSVQADGPASQSIELIENSVISVRITGQLADNALDVSYEMADGSFAPNLHKVVEPNDDAVSNSSQTALDAAAKDNGLYEFSPVMNGVLKVSGSGISDHQWAFDIKLDAPPQVAFDGLPQRALNGAMELSYEMQDDFGLEAAWAEIEPMAIQDDHAYPLYSIPEIRLQLPRGSDGKAQTSYDLTDHPLAGQDVYLTLVAVDGAGQEARSERLEITLPEKNFTNPLAQSVVEQRQIFAFDAFDMDYVLRLNDALTMFAEDHIPDLGDYLLLKSIRSGLPLARSDEELYRWVDDMWRIALILEDGNLSAAQERLRNAQRRLNEALENDASDEEIAQLMDELRDAMNELMQELARRSMENGEQAVQNNNSNQLEMNDLQNMLDNIEDLAKSGARDQAMQMLSELQNMMNNLQTGQTQQQNNDQQNPMRQQMDQLGQLLREQQQLMDETFALERRQQNQGEQQNAPSDSPQAGSESGSQNMTPEELADALEALRERQEQLQRDLDQLMQGMEAEGLAPSDQLSEAGEAMGQAGESLSEGQTGQAGGEQGRALQALREGAQQMLSQMQQGQGQGQSGGGIVSQFGPSGGPQGRDPLGRRRGLNQGENGFSSDSQVKVPDIIDVQRARRILQMLRERFGDNLRPELERQYLERLLDLGQ